MSGWGMAFHLIINEGQSEIYFMVQWFGLISLKTVWVMNVIIWDNESVGHDIWPHISCPSDFVLYLEGYMVDEYLL